MKQLYYKLCSFFTLRKISFLILFLFLLTLVPIIYLGLHNYPTGDDFWYGEYTHLAWRETGSIIEALKGSFHMLKEMYIEWQGTWFTIFLFTLSPSIFFTHGYYLTIFIALGLLIGGTGYFLYHYLVRKWSFPWEAWLIILCLVMYPAIQYIPRTTSGLFWFNGIMHYSVPYFLASVAIVQTQKFMDTSHKNNFLILFICFTVLGGGSYLMPMAATLIAILIFLSKIQINITDNASPKKLQIRIPKHNWLIFLAFAAELIGLLISFLSPGNSVRGGEEFGVDLTWALKCIWYAIDRGIYLGIDYFQKNPVTLLIYVGLGIFIWHIMQQNNTKPAFRFPALFVLYTNGIYWAIYTPEIYSRSDVSGGVPNTYFHVFLLVTLFNLIYVHGWIQNRLIKHRKQQAARVSLTAPSLFLILLLLLFSSHTTEIVTTNDYCMDFINSGKLEKYVQIREEQYLIMMDNSQKEVVVPEFQYDPYPFIHMSLSEDPNGPHNLNQAAFYDKTSIKAYFPE